ncbi:MAG TPA: cyclase family protein [Opitutaceae bacterium]|nr:cyclase family protein [Opitutaceae bacterium]
MRFFDLSQPVVDGGPNCPVHPPVIIDRISDHPKDGWRLEFLRFATHTGTHLDAPLHKISGGRSIDEYPLEAFAGRSVAIDLTGIKADHPIGPNDFARIEPAVWRDAIVLLATGWGNRRAKSDEWLYHSPALSPAGATWLVERGIRGVGIDHFSIGGMTNDNTRTHEILLGAGVWIIEDLRFAPGWKEVAAKGTFQALPLNFPGASGTPCRAVFVLQD